MILLSILTPTLFERTGHYESLVKNIHNQIADCNAQNIVQILCHTTERGISTGEKRNELLKNSLGKYVWQVDDDDEILPNAIKNILEAIKTDCDVIGCNGYMTTNGANRVDWEIRLNNPYCATIKDGKEMYLRFPNHITPMKREHAIKVKFPNKTLGEDYDWALELNNKGYLKTQTIIEESIYHYKFLTK